MLKRILCIGQMSAIEKIFPVNSIYIDRASSIKDALRNSNSWPVYHSVLVDYDLKNDTAFADLGEMVLRKEYGAIITLYTPADRRDPEFGKKLLEQMDF
jgi:hypothetical protein